MSKYGLFNTPLLPTENPTPTLNVKYFSYSVPLLFTYFYFKIRILTKVLFQDDERSKHLNSLSSFVRHGIKGVDFYPK